MVFKKISSSEPVVDHIANTITQHLEKEEKVLWLLSGGSSIKIEAQIAKKLKKGGIELKKLLITLADERYGPVGNKDSNWQQLNEAGFEMEGAHLHPVLTDSSLEETVKDFSQFLSEALDYSDYKIALAGIGADSHTVGIKPNSPATKTDDLVCGYKGDDFVRITVTPKVISQLDEVVSYLVGIEKHQVLDKLENDVSPEEMPAQYLKQVKRWTIYNDYKGETV